MGPKSAEGGLRVALPISSAILDMGTATSVDQTSVPSGRTARDAHRACFLADHRDCIDASSVADSNEWQPERPVISFAAEILSCIFRSDPENLETRYGYPCLVFVSL